MPVWEGGIVPCVFYGGEMLSVHTGDGRLFHLAIIFFFFPSCHPSACGRQSAPLFLKFCSNLRRWVSTYGSRFPLFKQTDCAPPLFCYLISTLFR
jgi:hypothetical protein